MITLLLFYKVLRLNNRNINRGIHFHKYTPLRFIVTKVYIYKNPGREYLNSFSLKRPCL